MNQEVLNHFQGVVHELFIRWDALKLAVEHMGGRNGQQVRRFYLFIRFFFFENEFFKSSDMISR